MLGMWPRTTGWLEWSLIHVSHFDGVLAGCWWGKHSLEGCWKFWSSSGPQQRMDEVQPLIPFGQRAFASFMTIDCPKCDPFQFLNSEPYTAVQLRVREIRHPPVPDAHGQAVCPPLWRTPSLCLLLLACEGCYLGNVRFVWPMYAVGIVVEHSIDWRLFSIQIASSTDEELKAFLDANSISVDVSSGMFSPWLVRTRGSSVF